MSDTPNRSDIARRIEKAEKLLQRGKAADALTEYLQILEINPTNDSVRQIAADLCISVNKTPQAVQLLGELFERQVAAGDATRASLIYKKLSRYASPTWEQKVRLGRVLETSNKKLAIATYESALEDLERQEKKEEELLVLRRIVSLDPSQANYLRVAQHSAAWVNTRGIPNTFCNWPARRRHRVGLVRSISSAPTARIRKMRRWYWLTAKASWRAAKLKPRFQFLSHS